MLKLLQYIFSICPKEVTEFLGSHVLIALSLRHQNKMGLVSVQYQYHTEIIYIVVNYSF